MTFQEQAFQIGSSPNNNWQRCYMIKAQHVPDARWKLRTSGETTSSVVPHRHTISAKGNYL